MKIFYFLSLNYDYKWRKSGILICGYDTYFIKGIPHKFF